MTVSVASDNYAIVYINGFLVDSDPSPWHQATYWNRYFSSSFRSRKGEGEKRAI
jgi:hypothetical protein